MKTVKTLKITSLKLVNTAKGPRYLVNGTEFLSVGQLQNAAGGAFHPLALIGSSITITYYADGEEMFSRDGVVRHFELREDSKVQIVKSVELTTSEMFQQAAINATVAMQMGNFQSVSSSQTTTRPEPLIPAELEEEVENEI